MKRPIVPFIAFGLVLFSQMTNARADTDEATGKPVQLKPVTQTRTKAVVKAPAKPTAEKKRLSQDDDTIDRTAATAQPDMPSLPEMPVYSLNPPPAPIPATPIVASEVSPLPATASAPQSPVQPIPAAIPVSIPAPTVDAKPVAPPPAPRWHAEKGKTVHETLNEWSKQDPNDAWNPPVWKTDREYVLQASADFEGDFETAATDLIAAFAQADPPLKADFWANHVLQITTPPELDNQ